jgi:hypothetical protein
MARSIGKKMAEPAIKTAVKAEVVAAEGTKDAEFWK